MVQADARTLVEKFIYSCSHDLRGPIATIKGLVRLAEDHPDQIESNNCMRMIGECSDKLDSLIRSLQQYMVYEVHNMRADIVDSSTLIDEAISVYDKELSARSIKCERTIQSRLWSTDRHYVSEILRHLISNAIAFSDPQKQHKHININILDGRGAFYLIISDNGLGIRKESQPRIFDIFYRGHESSQGSGLGLFLVKHLVTKMDGSIQICSQEKIGTTIKVKLPAIKLA